MGADIWPDGCSNGTKWRSSGHTSRYTAISCLRSLDVMALRHRNPDTKAGYSAMALVAGTSFTDSKIRQHILQILPLSRTSAPIVL